MDPLEPDVYRGGSVSLLFHYPGEKRRQVIFGIVPGAHRPKKSWGPSLKNKCFCVLPGWHGRSLTFAPARSAAQEERLRTPSNFFSTETARYVKRNFLFSRLVFIFARSSLIPRNFPNHASTLLFYV